MRKTGVIWLGHGDYLCDNTWAIQRAVVKSLGDQPLIEVEPGKIAVTEKEAVALRGGGGQKGKHGLLRVRQHVCRRGKTAGASLSHASKELSGPGGFGGNFPFFPGSRGGGCPVLCKNRTLWLHLHEHLYGNL